MKFLKKIKIATLVAFVYLMGIISAQATSENCECGEPENMWFRLTTEDGIVRKNIAPGSRLVGVGLINNLAPVAVCPFI